ncbi:MAG: hypothetical protein A2521_09310 [Deltaproteobacteria bacterium RIFOXYD12_FULL_57_12]|nr:MAG: hypothetical protein A2521_09310 [Deltaproteobacteria bacterium RIFOXYD12_FULL_57_12]
MRNSFVDTIVAECGHRQDLMIVSGDAGLGVFDTLQRDFPDRFLNLGVAEQNMAGFAAGLAMAGYKVFVYNIIPFLLYRCYEQVRNSICHQHLPVVLVGTGSGVTYAPAGISHYAVEDVGLARTLPQLIVISPADPEEARAAACYALTAEAPVYVRLAKSGERPIGREGEGALDITGPRVIRPGADIAVLFHGAIADEVIAASDALAALGVQPLLVSIPMLQPLDKERLYALLADMRAVLCVEEHFAGTGLGSLLAGLRLAGQGAWVLRIMGIPDGSITKIGDCNRLRQHFGISAVDIRRAVLELRTGLDHG